MMTDLVDKFRSLVDGESTPSQDQLDEIYHTADAVEIDDVLGEWNGGLFGLGHPIETMLDEVKWAGKSFTGPDDVAPMVCFDESGQRYANSRFGAASLKMVEFAGRTTATMVYHDLPMTDHLRRVSDDILIGAMNAPEQELPLYFYLTRFAAT